MNAVVKTNQKSEIGTATPMELLNVAVSQGADLDKLERLMELQERWEKGEAKKAYGVAMAKFQSELGPIVKKRTVDYTTAKGRTNYKFANIDDIAQSIRPLLRDSQLSYRFEQKQNQGLITVICHVTHALGHSEQAEMSGPVDQIGGKNAIQGIASTVQYLRRYTLTGLLGITTGEEDSDGQQPTQDQAKSETDVSAKFAESKTIQELVKVMNSLSPEDKRNFKSLYEQRRSEIGG